MSSPVPVRRLYREPADRVVAGVAAGIAAHLGASVVLVRVAFVALAAFNGLGALLYAAFWAVLPMPPHVRSSRRNVNQLFSFLALGVGMVLLVLMVKPTGGLQAVIGWLAAVIALGAGIIWHQADPKRRERWSATVPGMPWLGAVMDNNRKSYLVRFIGGGLLVVIGIIGAFVAGVPISGATLASIGYGLGFAAVALAGVGLALAPLLYRMFTQLSTEREARVREQERAELAAMVHDQVLHTLALIQRNAGDVKEVQRLARGQERTLRNWLYKPTASPTEKFSAALEEASAEVEDTFAIAVETVVVGDVDVDERVAAIVAAAREALVNAAKHAKVETVSLYAEVEPDCVSVFVRDRGVGFELTAVESDRHGVRGSILARMQRHGGKAEIRSTPGDGTEVRLSLPIDTEK
ncbi:PspC domain-containing protein [Dactylosporangium aurantiacum]|uniref:PspC domain-containing protein n=1 Tax=Dactylosporangium aurantiacum TaxID=35754 RepID=A0A9Q9IG98_9ACTN|nr:ATP-binding protein [Dactylosporangium aurantiacum]MDG6105377.1 PspC domain-containing protein [Dactylosporangium aurantiacum]UWZ54078.1 PspC domain-containing protein [Dactylosporangium aurantiacum]